MIRTQRRVRVRVWVRVRVRVRVIYLNQTGIRHQILGGVGVRVCTPDWMLRVRILLILSWIVFFIKNWRHFDFDEHFIKKFHIRKVKCLVRGGCQFGGWNQVTVLSDIKSLHLTHEYWLSAQQLTQQMVGEYFTFFQNYTRRKLSIAQNQTLFFDQFNQPNV